MTNEEAIALLKTGSEMPSTSHTAEMLDEACKLACRALKRPPNLCTILGVWPEQVFNWRGYTLKVRSDGVIGKKMVGDSWPGLEGPMVCELINNADEIMRQVQLDIKKPNEPLTLIELCGMIGEPVWIESPGSRKYGRWSIVEDIDIERKALYLREDYNCHDYGTVWLAYRRKPEEVQ